MFTKFSWKRGEIATMLTVIGLFVMTAGALIGARLSQETQIFKSKAAGGCALSADPEMLSGGICRVAASSSTTLVCALIDPSQPAASQLVAGQDNADGSKPAITWTFSAGYGQVQLHPYISLNNAKSYRVVAYDWTNPNSCVRQRDYAAGFNMTGLFGGGGSGGVTTTPPPGTPTTGATIPPSTVCPNAIPANVDLVRKNGVLGCNLSTNPPAKTRMFCTMIDPSLPAGNADSQRVVSANWDNVLADPLFFSFTEYSGRIQSGTHFRLVGYDQDAQTNSSCIITKNYSKSQVAAIMGQPPTQPTAAPVNPTFTPVPTVTPVPTATNTPAPSPTPNLTTPNCNTAFAGGQCKSGCNLVVEENRGSNYCSGGSLSGATLACCVPKPTSTPTKAPPKSVSMPTGAPASITKIIISTSTNVPPTSSPTRIPTPRATPTPVPLGNYIASFEQPTTSACTNSFTTTAAQDGRLYVTTVSDDGMPIVIPLGSSSRMHVIQAQCYTGSPI